MSQEEQQVQLTDLNPQQLQEVKRQLDEELEHLTSSFTALKSAQAKYRSCLTDVKDVAKKDADGKRLLVPLTSSLYVPGKIRSPETVIIDIGTGYYVKKTRPEAITYYEQKVAYVQSNLDKLQETIERKQENAQTCVAVLQMKMQEQTTKQQQGGGAAVKA